MSMGLLVIVSICIIGFIQFFFIYLNDAWCRTRLNESEDNSVSTEEIRFKERKKTRTIPLEITIISLHPMSRHRYSFVITTDYSIFFTRLDQRI